jgi:hypothetical protein
MQICPFRVRRSWCVFSAGLADADNVEDCGDLAVVSAAADHQVQQEPRLGRSRNPALISPRLSRSCSDPAKP